MRPDHFREPSEEFNPLVNSPEGHTPSEGLLRYAEAAASDLHMYRYTVSRGEPARALEIYVCDVNT